MDNIKQFYKGKRVFVTGHTGFKGTWLCKFLAMSGAVVTGYSLEPDSVPNIYELSELSSEIDSIIGDIRNLDCLDSAFKKSKPEIVFHLAAQPIVKEGYDTPVYTYDVNVMGTVNILECVRKHDCVKSVVNVTTDKVYKNNEWDWAYRENDEIDGFDPYSNSKSCSELITSSYKRSFFSERDIAISSMRAGNVIGGGDFADSRIIPDCYRAMISKEKLLLRSPNSIRPYQYVLESVFAYLEMAKIQFHNKKYEGSYNVGPNEDDIISTLEIVRLFEEAWEDKLDLEIKNEFDFHESKVLKLDSSKLKKCMNWKPTFNIREAMRDTAYFYRKFNEEVMIKDLLEHCLNSYIENRDK